MDVRKVIYSFRLSSFIIAGMSPVLGPSSKRRCLRMCMKMLIAQNPFRLIVLRLFLLSFLMELLWTSIENPTHHTPNVYINLLEHHWRPRLSCKVTDQVCLHCYYRLTYFGRTDASRHSSDGRENVCIGSLMLIL